MRTATILSAVAHLAVILVAWIGLPAWFETETEFDQAIPVEVVIATETPTPPPPKAEPKPEPPKPKPPPPPPQAAPPPPPPPPQQIAKAVPPPEPKPKPKAHEPPPAPVPALAPAAKAEPKPAPPPAAKPQPRVRPKPKARHKPKPVPENLMASVLKTVEKLKQDAPAPAPEKVESEAPARQSIDRALRLRTLADEVRRQIEPCWNMPAGAKEAESYVVEIRVEVGSDGRVRAARIVDLKRMQDDDFYRASAESALRAVLNPRCNPLKNLPVEAYDEWKTMTLRFDPKEMIGS